MMPDRAVCSTCMEKFDFSPEQCLGKSVATPKSGHGCCSLSSERLRRHSWTTRRNAGPRSARHETREGISNHKHHCAPSSSEVPFRPSPRGFLRPELSVTPKGVDGGLSSNTVRSTGSDGVSSQCLCLRAEGLKQSSCPHQRQAPKRGCAANNVIR